MLNKDFIDKFITKIKKNKKFRFTIIFFIVLIVICMFFLQNYLEKSNTEEVDDINIFVEELESNLTSIISEIDGAGKTKVMITIDSGIEQVLASNTSIKQSTTGTTTEETPIIVNGKTVVVKEKYPKVVGAVIVCEGANNLKVVNSIINATTSLLNIESDKIQILKMK